MMWGSQDATGVTPSHMDFTYYINNPEVFKIEGGFMSIPTGPGLGIEVNEARVREEDAKFRAGEFLPWQSPTLRGPGGEVREW